MRVNILHVRVVSVIVGDAEMSCLPLCLHLHPLVLNSTAVASNMLFIMFVRNREHAKGSRIQGSSNLRETNLWINFFLELSWNLKDFCSSLWCNDFSRPDHEKCREKKFPASSECVHLPLRMAILEESRASLVLYLLEMSKELNLPFSKGYFYMLRNICRQWKSFLKTCCIA